MREKKRTLQARLKSVGLYSLREPPGVFCSGAVRGYRVVSLSGVCPDPAATAVLPLAEGIQLTPLKGLPVWNPDPACSGAACGDSGFPARLRAAPPLSSPETQSGSLTPPMPGGGFRKRRLSPGRTGRRAEWQPGWPRPRRRTDTPERLRLFPASRATEPRVLPGCARSRCQGNARRHWSPGPGERDRPGMGRGSGSFSRPSRARRSGFGTELGVSERSRPLQIPPGPVSSSIDNFATLGAVLGVYSSCRIGPLMRSPLVVNSFGVF